MIAYIPAESRGGGDYGWLQTRYSFSFADYYDPERMGFGALRVLNDDRIAPGQGFGTHSHRDMEIITIPVRGAVAHQDSTGGEGVVRSGEVQVMSAGTGVAHSEFNASATEALELFQIWILPRAAGLAPRYAEKVFAPRLWQGQFHALVGPDSHDGKLMIHQDAWISRVSLAAGQDAVYQLQEPGNGVYFFVEEGSGTIGEQAYQTRDAVGVTEIESVTVTAKEATSLLAIEVPME